MGLHIIIAFIFAVLFAVLVVPFDTPIRRFFEQSISFFRWWWIARQTGLIAVYPRTSEFGPKKLKDLLQTAQINDTICFVARTNITVINDFSDELLAALSRGVCLKFLLYDAGSIDPRAFGMHVTNYDLLRDAGAALNGLSIIHKQCEQNQLPGNLLVYKTTIPVHNSVVIYQKSDNSLRQLRVLFDISFGKEQSQKFMHYYSGKDSGKHATFIPKLVDFYHSLYEPPSVFYANLSYVSSPARVETLIKNRIASILNANDDYEMIRHNSVRNLVPTALNAFHSIRRTKRVPSPISAQIELTNKCSTKCQHCNRWVSNDDTHMNCDTAKTLLDQMSSLGVKTITLSGGEPTQHPNFMEILEYASKKPIKIGVLSNGIGVSPKALESIIAHASWLRLSMDGVDGHTPGGYRSVRESLLPSNPYDEIYRLVQRFKLGAFQQCYLALCYTIQASNVDGVKGMIDWVRSLGLPYGDKHLVLKVAHGEGRYLNTREQLYNLILDSNSLLQSNQYKDAANLPYLRNLFTAKLNLTDIAEGRPTRTLYTQNRSRCFTPYIFTLVDPYGDVYPCCYLFEDNSAYSDKVISIRKDHCMGRFDPENKASLKLIWTSSKYENLRTQLSVVSPDGGYSACSRCTRHCNHNLAFSQLFAEYVGLQEALGSKKTDEVFMSLYSNGLPTWL